MPPTKENYTNFEFDWPFYFPYFPIGRNPLYNDKLEKECLEYCISISEFKDLDKSIYDGTSLWTPFTSPLCKNIERIKVMVILFNLLFYVDDLTENRNDVIGRNSIRAEAFWMKFLNAIEAIIYNNEYDKSGWKLLMFGIFECLQKIMSTYSNNQKKRFATEFKKYCLANIEECKGYDNNNEFRDAEYAMKINADSKAFGCIIQLLEYSQEIELTEEEYNDEDLKQLIEKVGKTALLCNDLFSFRKEITECNGKMDSNKNTIAVYIVKENLSIQKAFEKCVEIMKQNDEEFAKIEKEMRKRDLSENLKKYIKALKYWTGGNWLFSIGAKRYHGKQFEGVVPLAGRFIYDKDKTIVIPEKDINDKFKFLEKFYEYF